MGCCSKDDTFTTDVEALEGAEPSTTPEKTRRPRDVFFLLLFILMLGGMGYLAYFGIQRGDIGRYMNGVDSWGNVCGRKDNKRIGGVDQSGKDHSERPFNFQMAFSDIKMALNPAQLLNMAKEPASICVSECPTAVTSCADLLRDNGYVLDASLVAERVCTMPYGVILPHHPVINRCIPSQLLQVGSAIADAAAQVAAPELTNQGLNVTEEESTSATAGVQSSVAMIVEQLVNSAIKYWRDTIYLIAISLGVSLAMIIFLQLFSRIIVIVIMVVACLGSVALTGFLWFNYAVAIGAVSSSDVSSAINSAAPVLDSAITSVDGNMSGVSSVNTSDIFDSLNVSSLQESGYLLPLCIVVSLLTIIIYLILIWARKSLCLVVNLFDEASLSIFSMPGMLLQPFITLIAMGGVLAYLLIVGSYIFSVAVPYVDEDGFVSFVEDNSTSVIGLLAGHIFGGLWMLEFISGCQQVILAGAVANWFFTRGETQKKCKCNMCPTVKSTKDLILYHMGTVAFGSLIIAIVQFIRMVLSYVQRKLKGTENKTAKYILKCLSCCLACFEKFLKYVNRNAYICVAMYGDGFCSGAKRALSLLISNAQHVLALNCMSGFCILLGKLAVVVLTGFISFTWFVAKLGSDAPHTEYLAPMVIACLAGLVISTCFFNVYGMAIDTIFLCFCDDQQRNNGGDRPYYSSVKLQKYMEGAKKPKKRPAQSTGLKKIQKLRLWPREERPGAAKGKRTDKDGNKEVVPRQHSPLDKMSVCSDESVIVDAFDTLIDQVMIEREKSPLTKICRKEVKKDRKRRTQTPFPPIDGPLKSTSVSVPTVAGLLNMSYTPLPGQPVYDENEENMEFHMEQRPVRPLPLPCIGETPFEYEELIRPESDVTIHMANGEPMRKDSQTSVPQMMGDPEPDPETDSLLEYRAAAIPPQARFISYIN